MKTPSDSVIQSILEIYERGQTLDALELATDFAPLKDWAGVRGCCLASRIARGCGSSRLAIRLAARMWRLDRAHPLSQFEYGIKLLNERGPLAFWLSARSWPKEDELSPEWNAELLALKSAAASSLRDFKVAEELLSHAESIAPKAPWVCLQRSYLLERLENVEGALEVAYSACKLYPYPVYRGGVQTTAHLLQLLDREEEAIQQLRQADSCLQSSLLAIQLYSLLVNQQRWPEADQVLERCWALSPLMDPALKLWFQSQRALVAYYVGKRKEAHRLARELKDPFSQQFAENLDRPAPNPERVRLEVPFVRQHFKTCAPATMAALGRYWKMPAEHVKLVEAICYDGTPAWQQRDWGERNGWLMREFRLTWETAIALLNRGIPFAVSTVEATSAHMQAVMGFDLTRGTLLLRDPSQAHYVEVEVDTFLERYRAFGPHGMVLLPQMESSRLDGIHLPDSELYDEYHVLTLALSRYDRETAQSALGRLESQWPDHEICWEARSEIAAYDSNLEEEIRCLDRLLEIHPENPARLLRRLTCMWNAPREDKIEFLQKACTKKSADPSLFVELGRNLSADASQEATAERWLNRALRKRTMDSNVMTALANLKWRQGRFEEATELYRFAATTEGYHESPYQSWFIACRGIRQTAGALAELEDRFERFGDRSGQPAMTLAWALCELEQPDRALSVLADATQRQPDDGQLITRAAILEAQLGDWKQADLMLNSAKKKMSENSWLRAAAEIAEARLDAKAHLNYLREVIALEPQALDAHRGVARSLARLEGKAAAVAHLKEACALHPNHCGLRILLIEWLRQMEPDAIRAATVDFLKIAPRNAWARRELAWALVNLNRLEEAMAEAVEAESIEPRVSYSPAVLGYIHARLSHLPEARDCFHRAIALSVDNSSAINGLLSLARTDQDRRDDLAFVERELVRQVVQGDGLLTYMEVARPLLEPDALLAILRQAHTERPDLWHAWSALAMQLDHLGRHEEALPIARKATERFPHIPRMWLDLATIHRRRKEGELEIAAAQRAFEINPAWSRSVFALADALERHRTLSEAKAIYERGLKHTKTDPRLYEGLASILWRLGQPEEAMTTLETALCLPAESSDAWELLVTWSKEQGQHQRAVELARQLTREHPGEARQWLALARMLTEQESASERLNALDHAVELNPSSVEVWDLKAELLAEAGQFEAAVEACEKGVRACPTETHRLRARRAWIEAEKGNVPEAVRLMRQVLADSAGYMWGWQLLAYWLMQWKAFPDAESALRQVLKLDPQNNWTLYNLAVVRLNQGDKAGAERLFSAVFEALPTDEDAAENLFSLQMETGNFTGAAATLRRMQTHQPGGHTFAREVVLNAGNGNTSTAFALFRDLCKNPDADSWSVQIATEALKKAGHKNRALRILKEVLGTEACNPHAGAVAIQFLIDERQTLRAVYLFGKIYSPEARTLAAPVLAKGLGESKASLSLRILLWCYREDFSRDGQAWGQLGYALTQVKRRRSVATWMADWRTRPNVENWMLFNLCMALRYCGQYLEATEVAQYAVRKWGSDRQKGADLRLFLLVEEALSGSLEEAIENLHLVHVRSNVKYDQQLLAIGMALVELRQSSPETRRQQFRAISQKLDVAFPAWRTLGFGRDVRRTLRRAGDVFAQNGAGLSARWWFFWKLNWYWIILIAWGMLRLISGSW